jgi:8-oxo-dGTP pyrophosphatase MutT (NUDIX family)
VFHLIPPSLHRAGLRLAHALRKRWWGLRRPALVGCRVLVLDDRDRVLLVRHSYGAGRWMLPGGGIKRGEDPLVAAQRELREETGCVAEAVWLIETICEDMVGARHTVHVVAGRSASQPMPDGREILAAGFFAIDALPDPLAPKFAEALPRWRVMALRTD